MFMSNIALSNGEVLTEKRSDSETVCDAVVSVRPLPAFTMDKGGGNGAHDDDALEAQFEEKVAERTTDLRIANQQMEAFIFSATHNLRAPLRHMVGYVEILQTEAEPPLSDANLGYVARVSEAADRMSRLIDALDTFSRLGKSEMRRTNVDLTPLVHEVVGDFKAKTKHRSITWKIHSLPTVKADRVLLRHVLVNLISNAVKFTRIRADARIEIGSAPGNANETVIFIHDNGAGFDPLNVHKLFCVFQRLHPDQEFEGVGVGLANVRNIVHRHGGRTWAEGVGDDGATFYFSVPKQRRYAYNAEEFPSGA